MLRVVGVPTRVLQTLCGISPRKRNEFQSTKLKLVGDMKSGLTFHANAECGVCPAGFRSCFGPVFSTYGMVVYIFSATVWWRLTYSERGPFSKGVMMKITHKWGRNRRKPMLRHMKNS